MGVYSYYGLPHFSRIYAVEAHPDLAHYLRKHLEPRGKVLSVALSDHEGVTDLWIPIRNRRDVTTRSSLESNANPGFELRQVEVPVTTIDSLGIADIGVIKIDVEGHEFSVLNGAIQTLSNSKPVCIVEVEERHNKGGVSRAFEFFAEQGYNS